MQVREEQWNLAMQARTGVSKKTYREGTPHTAATTYHYIAAYTLRPLEGSRASWGTIKGCYTRT